MFNPFSRFKKKTGDPGKIPASCTWCGRVMLASEIAEHLNVYHTQDQRTQHICGYHDESKGCGCHTV